MKTSAAAEQSARRLAGFFKGKRKGLFWKTTAFLILAFSLFAARCWLAIARPSKLDRYRGIISSRRLYIPPSLTISPSTSRSGAGPPGDGFWKQYDFHLTGELSEWEEIIKKVNPIENHARYWIQIFKAMKSGLIDTWDYQVMFGAWRAGLVHIYPSKNLIVNLGYGSDATHTRFDSPLIEHASDQLDGFEVTLPVVVDPKLDDTTFYFRFLESLTSIWWLEAAIDLTEQLGWARWQNNQAQAELSRLAALTDKQAAAVAEILESRSRMIFKMRLLSLVSHFVYTVREAIQLARTRFNQLLARSRSAKPHQPVTGPSDSVSLRPAAGSQLSESRADNAREANPKDSALTPKV